MIINVAAYTDVKGAERDESGAFLINCEAVKILADTCKEHNIVLIHISTDYVFDGAKETPYVETDIINPINIYGKTKACGEQVIQERLDRYVIIRTSWLFSFQTNCFLRKIYTTLVDKGEANIIDDQIGSPTSIRSLAQFILRLISQYHERHTLHWGVFHFANKPYVSWYQFSKYTMKRMKKKNVISKNSNIFPCKSDQWDDGVTRPANSCLDTTKTTIKYHIEMENWKDEVDKIKFT